MVSENNMYSINHEEKITYIIRYNSRLLEISNDIVIIQAIFDAVRISNDKLYKQSSMYADFIQNRLPVSEEPKYYSLVEMFGFALLVTGNFIFNGHLKLPFLKYELQDKVMLIEYNF